jgi:hypothetical protein
VHDVFILNVRHLDHEQIFFCLEPCDAALDRVVRSLVVRVTTTLFSIDFFTGVVAFFPMAYR